ncbi:hypothetical protein KC725_05745, partial [Candidatus Peregrinibacteria bacterium]|nr:hypothetical protein [Candidatus Peregrinibacteria bacterium]
QTPTGCHKSEGRYYDPQVGKCVHPSSPHEARILNEYRYVNKLAEEGKVEEVEYRVNFKQFFTLEKAEELWSDLRDHGAKMYIVSGTLPDGSLRNMQYPRNPRVWSGGGLAVGWHKGFLPNSTLERATIKEMLEEQYTKGDNKELEVLWYQAIFDKNDMRVDAISVYASPTIMPDFWNRHLDDIMSIQPLVTSMDTSQGTLGPTEILTDKE